MEDKCQIRHQLVYTMIFYFKQIQKIIWNNIDITEVEKFYINLSKQNKKA